MPLKISRQIEISSRKKVGRNEPCPCGSGKKYKKCCLEKEQEYLPKVNKGEISLLIDWAIEQSFFQELLKKKVKEFFGDKKIGEEEIHGLIEALIFEEKIDGKTTLKHFVEKASLTKEEKLIYQSWLTKSFFSIFEVIDVDLGKSLRLRDLINNQYYFVSERMGTYQMEKGIIFASRLLPIKEFWMFAGGLGMILSGKEEAYWLKRNLKNTLLSSTLQLDFMKVFYGEEETQEKTIESLSHEQTKKLLSNLLKKHQISYQISEIETMILENNAEPNKIIQALAKKATKEEEFNEWTNLFYHYWQTHPKFTDKEKPGPKEKILINQMMLEFEKENLEELTAEEINKLSIEFSKRWLNTPQQELESKTPKEVIIEERIARGSTIKEEPSYNFSFASIPASFPPAKEIESIKKYNLATKLMAKEHQYLKALELFSELYSDLDFLEEKFRWYGKIGTCLTNLGEIELGKKYFEKSLQLNPDYKISLKNLEVFNYPQELKEIKKHGEQQLFNSVLEKSPIFIIPEIEKKEFNECELLQDVISFLKFLDKNPVPVSLKQKLLRFKDVLVINKKLIQPDPEVVEIENFSDSYRYEWQMPKVRFLHLLTLVGKLSQIKNRKLILTLEGKEFLSKNEDQQFSQIFNIWFAKLKWATLEDTDKWRPNLAKPIIEILQNQSWWILETLRKFGEKKFNQQEFLNNVLSIDQSGEKEKFGIDLLLIFIERTILDQLGWANIIKPDQKSKIETIFSQYNKFFTTRFGLALIKSIRDKMDNAIPAILKNLD